MLAAGNDQEHLIHISGQRVYLAKLTGLSVVDAGDSAAPVILSAFETAGSARTAEAAGDLIVIADERGDLNSGEQIGVAGVPHSHSSCTIDALGMYGRDPGKRDDRGTRDDPEHLLRAGHSRRRALPHRLEPDLPREATPAGPTPGRPAQPAGAQGPGAAGPLSADVMGLGCGTRGRLKPRGHSPHAPEPGGA
ncbi:MAG: hypothetical protein HGA45_33585 [Chloroflexales bacterium]|nr:hypothetical protein [Chloroflexales bacterium]